MRNLPYKEVLDVYANPFHELEVRPIPAGLINQSYKVTSKYSGESFLLQQINGHVFADPAAVQSNYEKLWQHLKDKGHDRCIPAPKYFPGDTMLYCDSDERYWRVFEFVEDTKSLPIATSPEIARQVAELYGCFTKSLSDFDIQSLHATIPDFHNLALRFQEFETTLRDFPGDRTARSATLVQDIKKRSRYVHFFEVLTDSEELRLRVMHHDAKISNILFDKKSNNAICPVDLDTVMPGFYFSDLGDMIRSMASSVDEDCTDFEKIDIRGEYYMSIVEGYLEFMTDELTVTEEKYLHYSGLFMIYMQAIRFLNDYLQGDVYYKSTYPGQNFDRAKNQLILLTKLESFLAAKYGFPG